MGRIQWLWRCVFFLAGAGFGLFLFIVLKPATSREAALSPPIADKSVSKGPWGTLEFLEIPLADKEELAPDRTARLQPPQWFFEGWDQAKLLAFIQHCDLDDPQRLDLCQTSRWQVASNGLLASPSPNLVRSLRPSAREQIYTALAESSWNYNQRFPFRFSPGEFEQRLASSGLSRDHLNMISRLIYSDGEDCCFTDLDILSRELSTNEFESLVDCLYRLPAYRLRLRILPDSDIDALVAYWGKGNRKERIRPLLESLTKVRKPGGVSIGIGALMPAFASLHLNTFPRSWQNAQTNKEDCFWTALNFFNDQPDPSYLDPIKVRDTLASDFIPITGAPTFGDLILLTDSHGKPLHASVYIAADFVFTKNGVNPLAPWVLMRIEDLFPFFPAAQRDRTKILRRRTEHGTGSANGGLKPRLK